MKTQRGFSLVEMIVILAVLAILLPLGWLGLQRYLARVYLSDAAHSLVAALNEARGNARKKSLDQSVAWSITNNEFTISGKTFSPEHNIRLSNVTGTTDSSFNYTAPYGRLAGDNVEFTLSNTRGQTSTVRVVGVTGKVIRFGF